MDEITAATTVLPDSLLFEIFIEVIVYKKKKLFKAQHARLEISEKKKMIILSRGSDNDNSILADVPLADLKDTYITKSEGTAKSIKIEWTTGFDTSYMTFHLTSNDDMLIRHQIVQTVRIKARGIGAYFHHRQHSADWNPWFSWSLSGLMGLKGEYPCCKSRVKYHPGCCPIAVPYSRDTLVPSNRSTTIPGTPVIKKKSRKLSSSKRNMNSTPVPSSAATPLLKAESENSNIILNEAQGRQGETSIGSSNNQSDVDTRFQELDVSNKETKPSTPQHYELNNVPQPTLSQISAPLSALNQSDKTATETQQRTIEETASCTEVSEELTSNSQQRHRNGEYLTNSTCQDQYYIGSIINNIVNTIQYDGISNIISPPGSTSDQGNGPISDSSRTGSIPNIVQATRSTLTTQQNQGGNFNDESIDRTDLNSEEPLDICITVATTVSTDPSLEVQPNH